MLLWDWLHQGMLSNSWYCQNCPLPVHRYTIYLCCLVFEFWNIALGGIAAYRGKPQFWNFAQPGTRGWKMALWGIKKVSQICLQLCGANKKTFWDSSSGESNPQTPIYGVPAASLLQQLIWLNTCNSEDCSNRWQHRSLSKLQFFVFCCNCCVHGHCQTGQYHMNAFHIKCQS